MDDLRLRWGRIQNAMAEAGADGMLLTDSVNLFYACGRVFNGLCYVPAEGEPWFFVRRPGTLTGPRVRHIRKIEELPDAFGALGLPGPQVLLLEADEIPYSEFVRIEAAIGPVRTGNATAAMRRAKMVKTPWEIEQMRISCAKQSEIYNAVPSLYRPGMTDVELQIAIEELMRRRGSIGHFRAFGSNMEMFMGSLLAGDNAAAPSPFDYALGGAGWDPSSPVGASRLPLREGMTVSVDMAGNFTPYMGDMTRTFSVGAVSSIPEAALRAHEVSIAIHGELERIAGPGASCAGLYEMAVLMAREAGLADHFMGTVQQAKFVGHGIGLHINELPVFTPRSKDTLQAGMLFAFEPKFVFEGTGAVGVEDSYLVTETGVERLTNSPREILPLK